MDFPHRVCPTSVPIRKIRVVKTGCTMQPECCKFARLAVILKSTHSHHCQPLPPARFLSRTPMLSNLIFLRGSRKAHRQLFDDTYFFRKSILADAILDPGGVLLHECMDFLASVPELSGYHRWHHRGAQSRHEAKPPGLNTRKSMGTSSSGCP